MSAARENDPRAATEILTPFRRACPLAEVSTKRELSLEDWAEMRRLHRVERMPIKAIARVIGCSKNTVKAAIRAGPAVVCQCGTGVSSRYERASLIVTSNKTFGRWGEMFRDDVVAAAMIDRLVHHAEESRSKATPTDSKTETSAASPRPGTEDY